MDCKINRLTKIHPWGTFVNALDLSSFVFSFNYFLIVSDHFYLHFIYLPIFQVVMESASTSQRERILVTSAILLLIVAILIRSFYAENLIRFWGSENVIDTFKGLKNKMYVLFFMYIIFFSLLINNYKKNVLSKKYYFLSISEALTNIKVALAS